MLQLHPLLRSAFELEAQCGPLPTLLLFDGDAPPDVSSPDAGPAAWQVTLPAGWQRAAEHGVLCQFRPDDHWTGHWRVRDANGTCRAQGDAAVGSKAGVSMRLDLLELNTQLTTTYA